MIYFFILLLGISLGVLISEGCKLMPKKPVAPAMARVAPPPLPPTPEQIARHEAFLAQERADLAKACAEYRANPHASDLLRDMINQMIDAGIPMTFTSTVRVLQ
jgi:hypothetical protein